MTSSKILSEIQGRGIQLRTAGNRLMLRPMKAVTPDLLEAIKSHRTELLKILNSEVGLAPASNEQLVEAESEFTCLDTAPLNAVYVSEILCGPTIGLHIDDRIEACRDTVLPRRRPSCHSNRPRRNRHQNSPAKSPSRNRIARHWNGSGIARRVGCSLFGGI